MGRSTFTNRASVVMTEIPEVAPVDPDSLYRKVVFTGTYEECQEYMTKHEAEAREFDFSMSIEMDDY